ncbi:MAG: isochorismate synthase MenF [Nitriliruptoraceae bacterium]
MIATVRTVALDDDRPLLDLLPATPDALAWVRDGEGLVAWGVAARLDPGPGADRFTRAGAALARLAADAEVSDEVLLPGTGLVAVGSFTFEARTPGSVVVVPRVVVGRRQGVTWRTDITPSDGPTTPPPPPVPVGAAARRPRRDRPRYAGSSLPDVHWLEAVARAVKRIQAGEADKVVLARDHAVWSREPFDPLDLARRLTARFPRCHTFVVDGLVGATPELLLAKRGGAITSRVLAGTTGRSVDEARDAALGAALLASEKDRAEHAYAAASVAEVLAPRCTDLAGDPEPRLLRLDNVQHLATTYRGNLEDPTTSVLDLVGALHPTAAVGGTPREVALRMITELEGMARGRYAAPVGWLDAAGDGEWGIALRCAELQGARARLFAGVGVVAASLPEAELEETRLKLRAMQAVLDADEPL